MPIHQPGTYVNRSTLLENHLFRVLNEDQLQQIVHSTCPVRLAAGETLFTNGQPAEHFYLIVDGHVKLFRTSRQGHEKIIEISGKGNVFAEAVMFMEQPRYPVSAAAIDDCLLYRFSNPVYLELLSGSQELCFALFADLCKRLHQLLHEMDLLSFHHARYRLVEYLNHELKDSGSRQIILRADKKTIASRLSITPETLSRILHELTDEGIVSVSGKTIEVHDLTRLRSYLGN